MGSGVSVTVGVNVEVAVGVRVGVLVGVNVGVGVGDAKISKGNEHPETSRIAIQESDRMILRICLTD